MRGSSFESGVTENLTGVYGRGPTDVWVSGDGGSVLHWDGEAWTVAIAVRSTRSCSACGRARRTTSGSWASTSAASPSWARRASFAHWTGTVWSASDVPGSETLVEGVGVEPERRLAGRDGAASGLIYRGNGMNFDPARLHRRLGARGLGKRSGRRMGRALDRAPAALERLRVDGRARPRLVGPDVARALRQQPRRRVAVGDAGVIAHYASGHWAVSPAPTTQTLFGVWSPTPSHGVARRGQRHGPPLGRQRLEVGRRRSGLRSWCRTAGRRPSVGARGPFPPGAPRSRRRLPGPL